MYGVLHISIPPNGQGTAFGDPRPAARVIEPDHTEHGPNNAGAIIPKHEPGQLFIFPSFLPPMEYILLRNRMEKETIALLSVLML